MYNKEKERLFVDMDGTLAVFQPVDTMETLYEKGYFANLTPHQNVIDGMKAFLAEHQDIEVYVLSSVLSDSPYALEEKQAWLDRYFPEIDQEHRIFSPCGQPKAAYVPGGIRNTDMLLDDYSDNLHDWEPPGMGIKLMNGINGTKGTWKGKRIRYDLDPSVFSSALYLSIIDRQKLRQELMQSHEEYENNEEDLTYAEAGITELRAQEYDQTVSSDAGETDQTQTRATWRDDAREGIHFRGERYITTRGRLSERYVKDGQISLIGAKAENPKALAALLQCYRNPIFETARGFYLKDGYIIASEAVSSRLPGITVWKTADGKPFSEHVNEKVRRLEADAFYMVHNHPTGNPAPSMRDILATQIEGGRIEKFAGHIVLDHTKFSLIGKDGSHEILDVPLVSGPDLLLEASIPHPLLGEKMVGTDQLAKAGRLLLDDNAETISFAAYIASDGKVREIQEMSNVIVDHTPEFQDHIRNEMLGCGAANAVLYTTDDSVYERILPMITEGYFIDVLYIDADYGMYWSQSELGNRKKEEYLYAGLKEHDLKFYYEQDGLKSATGYEYLKDLNLMRKVAELGLLKESFESAWSERRIATESLHLLRLLHGEEAAGEKMPISEYMPLVMVENYAPDLPFSSLPEREQEEIKAALTEMQEFYISQESAMGNRSEQKSRMLQARISNVSELNATLDQVTLGEIENVLLISEAGSGFGKDAAYRDRLLPEVKSIRWKGEDDYFVIQSRDVEESLQDMLIIRKRDGEVAYAHGWNAERERWSYSLFYGNTLSALRKGAEEFYKSQQKAEEKWHQVYLESCGVTRLFSSFATKEEALDFCEYNDWKWADENAFVWNLQYDEDAAKEEVPVLTEDSQDVSVAGHIGTWHVIDSCERAKPYDMGGVATYYLLEHDTFGEDAPCVIVNSTGKLVLDEVYNGFEDLKEAVEVFDETLAEMERIGYRVIDVTDSLSCTLEDWAKKEYFLSSFDQLLENESDLYDRMCSYKMENGIEASDVTNIRCTGTESFPYLREKISTFDCNILGKPESMIYAVSVHDNGEESFHIYTENLDIWKKMTVRELEKLEAVLSKEVSFYEWNQEIQKANSLKELHDVSFGIDETENLNVTREQRERLYQAIQKREKEDFADHIFIDRTECIQLDEWDSDGKHFIIGKDLLQDPGDDFHHAAVKGNCSVTFAYDSTPSREKVEDDYLNYEAEYNIDLQEAEVSGNVRHYTLLEEAVTEAEEYVRELKEKMEHYYPDDADYQSLKYELVKSAEPQLAKARMEKRLFEKKNQDFQVPPKGIYSQKPAINSLVQRIDRFIMDFDPYSYDESNRESNCRLMAWYLEKGKYDTILEELSEKRDMLLGSQIGAEEEVAEAQKLIYDVSHFKEYEKCFQSGNSKKVVKKKELDDEIE